VRADLEVERQAHESRQPGLTPVHPADAAAARARLARIVGERARQRCEVLTRLEARGEVVRERLGLVRRARRRHDRQSVAVVQDRDAAELHPVALHHLVGERVGRHALHQVPAVGRAHGARHLALDEAEDLRLEQAVGRAALEDGQRAAARSRDRILRRAPRDLLERSAGQDLLAQRLDARPHLGLGPLEHERAAAGEAVDALHQVHAGRRVDRRRELPRLGREEEVVEVLLQDARREAAEHATERGVLGARVGACELIEVRALDERTAQARRQLEGLLARPRHVARRAQRFRVHELDVTHRARGRRLGPQEQQAAEERVAHRLGRAERGRRVGPGVDQVLRGDPARAGDQEREGEQREERRDEQRDDGSGGRGSGHGARGRVGRGE